MRIDDSGFNPQRWSNAKLIERLRAVANLETLHKSPLDQISADTLREETRIYRDSNLAPVLDEIEKRFIKKKKRADT